MSKDISVHPELKKKPVTIRVEKWLWRKLKEEADKKPHWNFSTIIGAALKKKKGWGEPAEDELDELDKLED